VFIYHGWNKVSKTKGKGIKSSTSRAASFSGNWPTFVNDYDVVITTYSVLKNDIYVARAAPDRPRREDASYSSIKRERSPIVQVEWLRVIMDEVQMAGGGKVEYVLQ
jgi:E3 ubiquitin-protein ligase SHPRH